MKIFCLLICLYSTTVFAEVPQIFKNRFELFTTTDATGQSPEVVKVFIYRDTFKKRGKTLSILVSWQKTTTEYYTYSMSRSICKKHTGIMTITDIMNRDDTTVTVSLDKPEILNNFIANAMCLSK